MRREKTNGKATEKPFVIAVDGPAAAGKGTLARMLAKKLGYRHLDSGKLYRSVAQNAEQVWKLKIPQQTQQIAKEIEENLRITDEYLEQIYRDEELREEKVAISASRIAPQKIVREALAKQQVAYIYSSAQGIVLDGRDMGTVICPEAPCKIFLTASPEVRAKRRYKEMLEQEIPDQEIPDQEIPDQEIPDQEIPDQDALNQETLDQNKLASYDATLRDMRARDARDLSRTQAPLRKADDAMKIDSSNYTIDQMLSEALDYANSRGATAHVQHTQEPSIMTDDTLKIDSSYHTVPLAFSKALDYAK